jgi:hypothetical protein
MAGRSASTGSSGTAASDRSGLPILWRARGRRALTLEAERRGEDLGRSLELRRLGDREADGHHAP